MAFETNLKGRRIKLIRTDDQYTDLKSGDMGTIELVNVSESPGMESKIFVEWDNGSNLMLLVGVDHYEIQ